MNDNLTSKTYFKVLLFVPLILMVICTGLITFDMQSSFCWTKSCLDMFVDVYNIPLQLLGLTFITTGAAFTYYQIDLAHKQHQRRLYNSFRAEFFEMRREADREFVVIHIPESWLFSSLYPKAISGDNSLSSDFKEFLTDEEGFLSAMNALSNTINSQDGSRYHAGSYQSIANLFLWLRELITLDADVNIGYMSGAGFTDNYAQNVIGIAQDSLSIASIVNAFEGWTFFNNRQRRTWRKNIDRLDTIHKEAEQLSQILTTANQGGWGQSLLSKDLEKFQTFDILGDLPNDLRDNEFAKRYLYDFYTTSPLKGSLSEEAKEVLANALKIEI